MPLDSRIKYINEENIMKEYVTPSVDIVLLQTADVISVSDDVGIVDGGNI